MHKLLTSAAVYGAVTCGIIADERLIQPTTRIETSLEERFGEQEELLRRIEENTRKTSQEISQVSTAMVLRLSDRGTELFRRIANRTP